MMCTVTVRRLKPGAYDDFRAAMEPRYWPAAMSHVVVLRSTEDPDEVCTIGYLDLDEAQMEELRDSPELLAAEAERLERVAPFSEEVLVNEVFAVVDELGPPPS